MPPAALCSQGVTSPISCVTGVEVLSQLMLLGKARALCSTHSGSAIDKEACLGVWECCRTFRKHNPRSEAKACWRTGQDRTGRALSILDFMSS